MSARDAKREARWLVSAGRDAGAPGFAEHAIQRLTAGEATYGDRWTEMTLDQLIVELADEAADIGAWGVLVLQALEQDSPPAGTPNGCIARRLHGAILAGARAHRELELARAELRRRSAADGRRRFTPDVDGRCLNCDRPYSAHADLDCPVTLAAANGREPRR